MKLLWFTSLLLCALVRADLEISQQEVQDVNFHLGSNLLNVNLLTPEHEVTADDEWLIEKLSNLNGQRNFFADLIKNTLESFRPIVINGNDALPPLDPFHVNIIGPYHYLVTGVRASAQINNFRVEGLRWYVVDRVTFNTLRLALGVNVIVPWLTFTGTYDARAAILMVSHRAGGNYRVFLNRLEFGVDMRLGTNLSAGHLILRELNIKIDIHDTFIQITGMTGSTVINSFISNFVQSVTQDLVQTQMQNLSEMLSEQLFDVINEVLKDYTLADIMG